MFSARLSQQGIMSEAARMFSTRLSQQGIMPEAALCSQQGSVSKALCLKLPYVLSHSAVLYVCENGT
jgi:hypothetical protein